MEYNFGQLLQHLDRIKKCKKIPPCSLMSLNYEKVRTLRNYIEHGSPFYDFARFVTLGNKAVDARYNIICKGLDYVVELYRYLRELKDALKKESVVQKSEEPTASSASSMALKSPEINRHSIFSPVPCARIGVTFTEESSDSDDEAMVVYSGASGANAS